MTFGFPRFFASALHKDSVSRLQAAHLAYAAARARGANVLSFAFTSDLFFTRPLDQPRHASLSLCPSVEAVSRPKEVGVYHTTSGVRQCLYRSCVDSAFAVVASEGNDRSHDLSEIRASTWAACDLSALLGVRLSGAATRPPWGSRHAYVNPVRLRRPYLDAVVHDVRYSVISSHAAWDLIMF